MERSTRGFCQCFWVPPPKTTERSRSQWNLHWFGDSSAGFSRKHDCSANDARARRLNHHSSTGAQICVRSSFASPFTEGRGLSEGFGKLNRYWLEQPSPFPLPFEGRGDP